MLQKKGNKMRYPDFLKKGDTIGFVAPSFACSTEPYKSAFNNALKVFNDMGYKTLLGPNCYKSDGIGISTAPADCGRELMDMYTGKSGKCDTIISCGGGELMCETMEHVDLDVIRRAEPKWYVGYSDNTNFIFNQVISCDTAGIYAPCAASFGMEPWHESLKDVFGLLTGSKLSVSNYDGWEKEALKSPEQPLLPYNCTEENVLSFYPKDSEELQFSGRLLGGCLDVLVQLCGTEYDKVEAFADRYKEDGIVWFLESCDLTVFSMRRAMWQLKHSGWFKHVKGFIIGRPMHFDEPMMGLDRFDAIMHTAGKYGVPVVMDADLGHLPPMMPLIVGSYVDVHADARNNKLKIEMKLV